MFSTAQKGMWRAAVILLLFALIITPVGRASPNLQGEPPAQEVQEPVEGAVYAPGDHLVTNLFYNLNSPNILRINERVELTFSYSTTNQAGVLIFIRPYTNGAATPGAASHPSPVYPVSATGKGSGWFTIGSGNAVVDEIRITMVTPDQTLLLFEAYIPVHYQFSNSPNLVSWISLNPENPNVMRLDQWVNMNFVYSTNQNQVRIFARPFSSGALTPSYGGAGSPLYPGSAGEGSSGFTITSGQAVVDQIRIQMFTPENALLFEAFLPVYFRYRTQASMVYNLTFRPVNLNIFKYSENVTVSFGYTHNIAEGVRVFLLPFSGTTPSPAYAVSGSPTYPVGSGSGNGTIRLTAGPTVVDRVRVQMKKLDGTLLFEAFVPVHLFWAGSGPPPGPDMSITAIEVTQAVQDLNNSVDLVAGKKTYVRVHVSTPVNVNSVYMTLKGFRGLTTLTPVLSPSNPGGVITVRSAPNRGQLNDSFLFALPSSWTASPGLLSLVARLDPVNAKNDLIQTNNVRAVTVNLQNTPPLRLKIVRVRYTMGGTTYIASSTHVSMLESWLRRAYPIPYLSVSRATLTYPNSGLPNVDRLNTILAANRLISVIFSGENSRIVYYGMVDDGGDFMRGKASGIPGVVASGPTGTGSWGWDFDGSYGDWYGAHEIGHTRGRGHANFCGAGGGPAYPYVSGNISPATTGNTALYGFDIHNKTIYGPTWKDLMSYCDNLWMSDFTYEGIRSYLVSLGMMEEPQTVSASQSLVLTGLANLAFETASLADVYLFDQAAELPLPEPGSWEIALVSAANSDLAVYPFEPDMLIDGDDAPGVPAVIAEVIPWNASAVRVEIRSGGKVLDSRSVSANPPSVAITSPAGGAAIPAGPFTVTWTGSDPDGDALTYSLLHSLDMVDWQTVAGGMTSTSIALHTDLIPGGTGHFMLIGSDGLLTDDHTITVSLPLHAPTAEIITPAEGQIFFPTQTITLQGEGYDLEDGELGEGSFTWSSSIDGVLWTGRSFSTAELTSGTHTITLTVTDSDGMSKAVTRTITVGDEFTPVPLTLDAAPFMIAVVADLGTGNVQETLSLRSSTSTEVTWTASESLSWLSLSSAGGTTPSDIEVTINAGALSVGTHSGAITLTSDAQNTPLNVMVSVQVYGQTLFLPLVRR
jgi:hypothetical protein